MSAQDVDMLLVVVLSGVFLFFFFREILREYWRKAGSENQEKHQNQVRLR
jgi:hypothetical protein